MSTWYGHLLRMPSDMLPKGTLHDWKPNDRRLPEISRDTSMRTIKRDLEMSGITEEKVHELAASRQQ